MKEVNATDLEINRKDAVVIDCPINQIVGSNIIDIVRMAKNNYVIIATPWDDYKHFFENYDVENPHTWFISDWLDKFTPFYTIQYDGYDNQYDIDYNERDYFHICGYTANKELIEEMEVVMHCRFEFDIAYGCMYNFDENYNIIKNPYSE